MSLFIRFSQHKDVSKDRIFSFEKFLDSFENFFQEQETINILIYLDAPIIGLNEFNKNVNSFEEIYELIRTEQRVRKIGIKLDIKSTFKDEEIVLKAHLYPNAFVSRNMKDIVIDTQQKPIVELFDSENIKLLKDTLDKYNEIEGTLRIAQSTLIDEQKYDEDHAEKAIWLDYASRIDFYRDTIRYAKRQNMSEFALSNEDGLSRVINNNRDISRKFNSFVTESNIITQEASLILAETEEGSIEDFFKLIKRRVLEPIKEKFPTAGDIDATLGASVRNETQNRLNNI